MDVLGTQRYRTNGTYRGHPLLVVVEMVNLRLRTFFRKSALRHHGPPRTITLDGFEPSHAAIRRMGMRNEFHYRRENPVKIRSCQYLNNIVEQDHRRIKRRVQPMLGFKTFYNARRVIMGIELMQMLHKGQFRLAEV